MPVPRGHVTLLRLENAPQAGDTPEPSSAERTSERSERSNE